MLARFEQSRHFQQPVVIKKSVGTKCKLQLVHDQQAIFVRKTPVVINNAA